MKKGRHLVCSVCGSEYYAPPSLLKKGYGKTCSRKCAGKKRLRGEIRSCKTCGKNFYARRSQITQGYANFCSKECFAHTQKDRTTFQCVVCGASFERRPWQVARGYTKVCSRDCRIIWMRGEHPNLRVGLFTEKQKREWKDDHCNRCGATEDLQLDHIIPRFAGGKPTRENAQTLCRKCNRDKYWNEDRPKYLQSLES